MISLKTTCLKCILILTFLLGGYHSFSQNFFASLFAGTSNYSGELQDKKFSFSQSHPAFGLGLLFEINAKMLVRGDFTFGKVSANDKYGKNKVRNLSFYSNIYEYSLAFEYTLRDLYTYRISPYFFTGLALFDFNPYTKDINNNIILLAERGTEGQGYYQGRKEYKLREISIPIGGGFQWAITDNKRIGLVAGFRKTFTDYIDDVSTTYVDPIVLAQRRGQNTVNVAYRGDELPGGLPYPPEGTLRGNPKKKDWYYFTGITFRVRLLPKKRSIQFQYDYGHPKKARTDCPKAF